MDSTSTPILDEMMKMALDADEAGLKITCFVFGTGGSVTLWHEMQQLALVTGEPEPEVFTINEGEPSRLCTYGGYPCWYLPPPLVEEVFTEDSVQFEVTPAVMPKMEDQPDLPAS